MDNGWPWPWGEVDRLAAEKVLDRRRAVIVGNSDGIGYALTRRLLDDGWTVAGLSRSASDLRRNRYRREIVDVTNMDDR